MTQDTIKAEFIQPEIVIEDSGPDGLPIGDKFIWARHKGRPHLDALLATVHYSYAYHDNSTIRGVAERVAAVIAGYGPAIAMEAAKPLRRETGSTRRVTARAEGIAKKLSA